MSYSFQSRKPTISSADGTLIWAASAGRSAADAPVIVFVPGFSSSSLTFRKQFEDARLLDKYCLITYEPRGQGRSEKPLEAEAYSSKRNAEDFEAVCKTFGAKRVVLAGWSYGGLIPVDVFTHLGPDWIAGVIYLSGLPWRSAHPEIGHPRAFEVIPAVMSGDATSIAKGVGPLLESCFYQPAMESMSYTEYTALAGAIAQQDPSARALLLNERYQDQSHLLAQADTLPVILINGEHDEQISWHKADGLLRRHFVNYELKLIRDAAHSSFWERPEEVNKEIEAFVDKVWRSV
ncbi:Alpha/Beta hydrolase protein [Trichoderma sp. SZMC 28014]